MSRLPESITSNTGKLLLQAIADFGYDGKVVDAARQRKELYELSTPIERVWGGGFFSRKVRVTSSQIVQMLWMVGTMQSAHAKMMAYFLGFLDDGYSTISGAGQPTKEDDAGTLQFKAFIAALAFGGVHGHSVLIDA
jgi:hypothetical protein